MEKVTGIGGFFFKSKDSAKLNEWYETNLGLTQSAAGEVSGGWWTDAVPSIVCAESEGAGFGGSGQSWYIVFTVDDLDAMITQLRNNDVSVELKHDATIFGKFACLDDPEGNHIELWEASDEVLSHRPAGR